MSDKKTKVAVDCTEFNHNYFDSQKYFDYKIGEEYIRHNINVFNQITYKGAVFDAMYQTGSSFRNNDYTLPCNNLKLSVIDRTDRVLSELNKLSPSDMQTDDQVKNLIGYLACPAIESKADLLLLRNAIESNLQEARSYLDNLKFTPVINKVFISDNSLD